MTKRRSKKKRSQRPPDCSSTPLLTPAGNQRQLLKDEALRLVSQDHQSVIRMNSTYLETVDKMFARKGMTTTAVLSLLLPVASIVGLFYHATSQRGAADIDVEALAFPFLFVFTYCLPLCVLLTTPWSFEFFKYTHHPVRFNRKTGVVHVFREDGTVLTTPWDDLLFTLEFVEQRWEARGSVVTNEKTTTATESFALSYCSNRWTKGQDWEHGMSGEKQQVRAHWEFIRRYMKVGPKSVGWQVQFCMPIADRKESFHSGLRRLHANFLDWPRFVAVLIFPLTALAAGGRALVMKTCRIPRWPADIDAVNVIEQDDPYAIEGDADGNRIAVFPAAARAAGVEFGSFK